MNSTFKCGLLPSVFFALAAGVAAGWFAHDWQTPAVSVAHTSAYATTPTADTSPSPDSGHLLEGRIQLTEARLKNAQASFGELLRERDQLARTNSALDDARRGAETDKIRAERTSELMSAIANRLVSDDPLQVPQSVAETAVFSGQLLRTAADFETKWGEKPPPEGTPESAAYTQEMDALTGDFAAMMKSFGINGIKDISATPASYIQFLSLQLYGALQLNDSQWQQLDGALNRLYAEGYSRNLTAASRPDTGVDAWQQQRDALSRRAFTEIQTMLTPPQRANFERLYSPGFLWHIRIGIQ